ncbi:MAG: hypothetical protein ACRD5K_15175 [Candidatus Acidiferrales bacterium]
MYLNVRVAVLAFALAFAVSSHAANQTSSHPNAAPESNIVQCRVVEAHSSAEPAALLVIFRQQQKQDQPRLAALVKENSGTDAEVQIGGAWSKVELFRLRTCFGRGMLVFPSAALSLKDGDTFRIRFAKRVPK